MYTRLQYRCLTEQFIQVNDMRIFDARILFIVNESERVLNTFIKKKEKEEKQRPRATSSYNLTFISLTFRHSLKKSVTIFISIQFKKNCLHSRS